MTGSSYLRFPHLHGDLVTFVAEDDVWLAPIGGGRAWRVSSLGLPARSPRFSPDGALLAWSVIQGSSPEVVVAEVGGGGFRQLSFFGHASTRARGFDSQGRVLVTSAHEQADSRLTHAYALPLDGGRPELLPFGPVDSVAFAPQLGDERPVVLGSPLSREPAAWKRYRGGTAGKLWIDGDGNGEFELLAPGLDGNLCDPVWVGERIAFLSDHEGHGNLYSVNRAGGDLRRHTDHEDFYVRHLSGDGERLVYESAGMLWLLDGLDGEPERLEISLGSASTARRVTPLAASKHLGDVIPNHDGTASVVEAHGTVHWLAHQDGPARVIEASSGVRARLPRPLGQGAVAYLADHDGEEALFIRRLDESAPSGRSAVVASVDFTGGGGGLPAPVPALDAAKGLPAAVLLEAEVSSARTLTSPGRIPLPSASRAAALVPSPDGTLIAVGTAFGEVHIVDVEAGAAEELFNIGEGSISQIAWSPDSRWLAWAEPVTAFGSRTKIRLAEMDGRTVVDVTDGRFGDSFPAFTEDGRHLAFLSSRSFDPVYDGHGFDLAFPSPIKPYLVTLRAEDAPPFGPKPIARPGDDVVAGVEDSVPGEEAGGGSSGSGSAVPETTVDVEGIQLRVVGLPVGQGNYSHLAAAGGGLVWLSHRLDGVTGEGRARVADKGSSPSLQRLDLNTGKESTVIAELDRYALSGDAKKIVYLFERQLRCVSSGVKGGEGSESPMIDLERIRVRLEPTAVWRQAFQEAWRLQRDFFWAADMAGQDWDEVRARYEPLVERLGSHDDLVDLLWEVHGELGTSHAYVAPALSVESGAGAQGRLGAEFRYEEGWVVDRIIAGDSSDPLAISPLAGPGAGVRVGDRLLEVDGVALDEVFGPAQALVGAAGKIVELAVCNGEAHGDAVDRVRRIAVVPLHDEERLRYQEWVQANRRLVREASGGRYGYLHIPDMMARGWAQLHRDLDTETACDALIVDVRRNRGGHTSQLVAELIGRKVTGWSMPRGEAPRSYPQNAPRGPVVILADEFAGSDGDIITQVSKLRGIGPVVGMRTWGGVVGIDRRFSLADGTGVTQPRYANWFEGGIGWSVENRGVEPDIEVPFPPHAHAAGQDPQLEQGVAVLREMLEEIPTHRPPAREGYQRLRPEPLPPRPQGSGRDGESAGIEQTEPAYEG